MKYILPKLQDIFFISILLGVILLGPKTLNADGDLGRHLTVGNYILLARSIPTKDLFSNTRYGESLTPHEWLAEVSFAAANRLLGLDGVVILEGLIIAITLIIVFRDSLERGKSYFVAGCLTFWAAAASSLHWIARPHLFTFLFLATWTIAIRKVATGKQFPLWVPPAIMLIWANTHGAFITGFVVWGCYLIGAIWNYHKSHGSGERKIISSLVIVGAISLLATLVNPAGWRLWATTFGFLQNSYLVGHTVEYFPPDFHNPGTYPFLLMIGFMVWLMGRSWNKVSIAEGLLLSCWVILGLFSARNIPLFAIVSAPILAGYLSTVQAKSKTIYRIDNVITATDTKLVGVIWPAIVIVVLVILSSSGRLNQITHAKNEFDKSSFPVAAVDWLTIHPQTGKMFNYFTWGGYLLFRLWPEQRVFIDGQTDFYGEGLTREYEALISQSPGWESLLDKHDISWVIVPPNSALGTKMQEDPNWSIVYQDETAVIAKRKQ